MQTIPAVSKTHATRKHIPPFTDSVASFFQNPPLSTTLYTVITIFSLFFCFNSPQNLSVILKITGLSGCTGTVLFQQHITVQQLIQAHVHLLVQRGRNITLLLLFFHPAQ